MFLEKIDVEKLCQLRENSCFILGIAALVVVAHVVAEFVVVPFYCCCSISTISYCNKSLLPQR